MSCDMVAALDELEKHVVRCVKCGAATRIGPLRINALERKQGRARLWPEDLEAIECTDDGCGFWILPSDWVDEARRERASKRGLS